MQVEVGKIYEGKVKGITKYGAFVEIENGVTGMVHISEISNTFVNEIRDHLTEQQVVKVKVLNITDEGKISLSIKRAVENQNNNNSNNQRNRPPRRDDNRRNNNVWEPKKQTPMSELSFEDMLSRFKQNSEEKMCDIKRNTDRKNGSRRSK
ncbi:MAG TPA: RNA-binding protein S1 [Ruminococcus sp.]|nr:RNA-binding protein S1 [Ruminococcus sp.]